MKKGNVVEAGQRSLAFRRRSCGGDSIDSPGVPGIGSPRDCLMWDFFDYSAG